MDRSEPGEGFSRTPSRPLESAFTLVEVVVSAALLSLLALAAATLLAGGFEASRAAVARQETARSAAILLERITNEVSRASAGTIVVTGAHPDEVTFRPVTGYDVVAAAPILGAPVTIRRVAAGAVSVVERVQAGASTGRLGAGLAAEDALDPTLPGLWFALRAAAGAMFVDLAITVRQPSARGEVETLRLASTVRLACP